MICVHFKLITMTTMLLFKTHTGCTKSFHLLTQKFHIDEKTMQ